MFSSSHSFRLLTVGKMQLILLPTLNFSSIPGYKNESSVNIRTHNIQMNTAFIHWLKPKGEGVVTSDLWTHVYICYNILTLASNWPL